MFNFAPLPEEEFEPERQISLEQAIQRIAPRPAAGAPSPGPAIPARLPMPVYNPGIIDPGFGAMTPPVTAPRPPVNLQDLLDRYLFSPKRRAIAESMPDRAQVPANPVPFDWNALEEDEELARQERIRQALDFDVLGLV